MQFDIINGNDWLQNCKDDFEATAMALYRYQYQHNELYKSYHQALKIDTDTIKTLTQIPFLPISFFKTHKVSTVPHVPSSVVFDSSGTTGMIPSKHFVHDVRLYETISLAGFEALYGSVQDWVILALLPSYLERKTSSLVHMAKVMMDKGGHPENGFYLNEWDLLQDKLVQLKRQGKKVLLLGVTFALIDFAMKYPMDLAGVVVMETGGMKGRQAEWTREQVHHYLKNQWQLDTVHSEYGMTELLSQAYSKVEGLFEPIPTMRAYVRDPQDPLGTMEEGSGVLNIIDLANVYSCAFIATEDMGKVYSDKRFEVLGRMDFAALRGCSMLAL
jgi:hypothetical protein